MKINHIITNETIEVGDHFDIELGSLVIESRVVDLTADGVVIEGDEKALALLGLSGALLESISEASLGDYRKKAQQSKALAQMAQVFGRSPEEREQATKTVARRERGAAMLAKRDAKASATRADLAKKSQADAVAKDREQLPQLQAQLAKLEAEFDPDYEYSDDYSVWSKQKDIAASIAGLKQRIAKASEQGVAEAGNKSLEPHIGMGDSRTPRELKTQMRGASDEFVRSTADKKTGPFHSKVAKMQNKLAKSELRRREQGLAEGLNDTIYPNAEVIKSKNGKPVGEIYQDGNSWGAFHYRADRGYEFLDSREDAIEALKDLHQETGRSRPDYTIKGVAEGLSKQFEIIYREQNGDRKRKIVSGTSKEAVARQFKKQYKLEIEQVKQLQQGLAEGLDQPRESGKAIQSLQNLAIMKPALTMQQLSQAGREAIVTNAIDAAKTLEQTYLQNKQQGNAIFVRALRDEIDNFMRGSPINASFPEIDNASELGDLLQGKLGKVNFQQSVSEGMFGLSAKEKGGIQHITSKISDIPGNWDHQAQTFTERGLEQLKKVLNNNSQYIKYALNLTADDYNADLDEAKYQGRTVQLNKPMQGDVAKSKVYVKDPKTGNVKKVNFGDPNMRIKKSNPKRRKSFRARHRCDTAKDKTTARYWSCRAW